MTATDWAALEERYGETRRQHLCPTCGGWWASCECPNADDVEAERA